MILALLSKFVCTYRRNNTYVTCLGESRFFSFVLYTYTKINEYSQKAKHCSKNFFIPRSLAAPQPPNMLPPIAYSMASQRRHQNSSGSSGLGSTSDEITYPQISKWFLKSVLYLKHRYSCKWQNKLKNMVRCGLICWLGPLDHELQ
jgi:hypothetical protein